MTGAESIHYHWKSMLLILPCRHLHALGIEFQFKRNAWNLFLLSLREKQQTIFIRAQRKSLLAYSRVLYLIYFLKDCSLLHSDLQLKFWQRFLCNMVGASRAIANQKCPKHQLKSDTLTVVPNSLLLAFPPSMLPDVQYGIWIDRNNLFIHCK